MLFFQALFFYAPHWLWKQMEGGRMKVRFNLIFATDHRSDLVLYPQHVIVGLNNHISDQDKRKDKIGQLAEYLGERLRFSSEHLGWALKFFICECLNMANVVAQIFITDAFLGGEFLKYGIEVIQFPMVNPEERVDPMSKVFPKMTKCTFHKYGSSGTIQRLDALCVLGMNVMSEKIYIFLWFWFLVLAGITGFNLLVRALQLFSSRARNR